MKRKLILAIAAASMLPLATMAAEHNHGGSHSTEASAPARSPMLEGTVKKLDKEKGRITLSHGAMHGMPAMTMIFTVKDKAMLKGAKEGGKALFRTETVNGTLELVEFKPVAK